MKKVWIDAGHGGRDPGATANGLREKDIVLAVSKGIKSRLETEYTDVQVLMSRSTDVFLELSERTKAANQAGADLLVSVHCNAGGGAGGFESFRHTSPKPATVAFQHALHTEIMAALKPLGVIDRGQKARSLHMVRESAMPAVLTENLFVDAAADAARLNRPEVIDSLIEGHVKGIVRYLGLKRREEPPAGGKGSDTADVSPWAQAAWKRAVDLGLFDGTRPGAPVTREELAVVLMRFMDQLKK